MNSLNAVQFDGKKEYVLVSGEKQSYSIGQIIFSILDTDWEPLISDANKTSAMIMNFKGSVQMVKRMEAPLESPYYLAAAFNSRLNSALSSAPVLYYLFSSQAPAFFIRKYPSDDASKIFISFLKEYPSFENTLNTCKSMPDEPLSFMSVQYVISAAKAIKRIQQFKTDIESILNGTLDTDSPNSSIPLTERYHTLPHELRRRYERSDAAVSVKCSLDSDSLFVGYYSEDICSLAFLEFEYMYVNGISVRKCESCGRYFLPFSSLSRYCERIADDKRQKSCKDIAAIDKYNDKLSRNSAKKLYQQRSNAYQMRCSRSPSAFPRTEYELWREMAKKYIKALENGEITEEQFDTAIQIPGR